MLPQIHFFSRVFAMHVSVMLQIVCSVGSGCCCS